MSECGKGGCIDVDAYINAPEPTDTTSTLIRRCAKAIDTGADQDSIRDICLQAGQSEEEAMLTYLAAKQLSNSRQLTCPECGRPFEIDDYGIAQHLTDDGQYDYDRDRDHVPYKLED